MNLTNPLNSGVFLVLSLLIAAPFTQAKGAPQQPNPIYFVDGYHGGIYGHYPIEWKTRFLVEKLEAHPEWRIGIEIEPETWDTVALRTPADYARFKSIAANKRVEFTNPTYAQPYCYNVSGESLIRQFAYGIRKIHAHFPDVEFVTYAVEEPCFTSSLPQILRQFGFKYATLKSPNTCWGGYAAAYGGELVNWIGPDGTSILTSPRHACEELQKGSVWQTTSWGNDSTYLAACRAAGIAHPVGMCYQDAGWNNGPWIGTGDSIKNSSIYVTWREYFEQITDGKTSDNYHFSQEEVRASLMWGTQVMQRLAQQVRSSENNLVKAEKMSTIAHLTNGFTYTPATLDEAWRTLLLAQHHDSWIVPYNGLNGKGTWADHIARWTAATDSLCRGVITAAGASFEDTGSDKTHSLRIYNTLGTTRCEVVTTPLPATISTHDVILRDDRGRITAHHITPRGEICFKASVPPFGYTTYHIARKGAPRAMKLLPPTQNGEVTIENDRYRITFDAQRGGIITSLRDKLNANREVVDTTNERAFGELRGHFYDEGRFYSSTEAPAIINITNDNPFEQQITICGTIASHPFTQILTLRADDPLIDATLRIDWRGNVGIGAYAQRDGFNNNSRAFYDDRYNLLLSLPAALNSPILYKDAPFDVCRSTLRDTNFSTWDNIKHNIILHWVDLAEAGDGYGLALLADHTTSYSYSEDRQLALTVQFSGNGLWGRDHLIDGVTEIRYALIPHRGLWDTAAIHDANLSWMEPLICAFTPNTAGSASLLSLDGTGYELSAAYIDNEQLLVRFYNASGDASIQKIRFEVPFTTIEEVDLNGNTIANTPMRRTKNSSTIEVQMPRFGLKTYRLTK